MMSTLRRLGGTASDTSPELLPLEDEVREGDPGTQIIGQEVAIVEPVDPSPGAVVMGRESGKGKGFTGSAVGSVRKSPGEAAEKRGEKAVKGSAGSSHPEVLMVTPLRGRRAGEDRDCPSATVESGFQSAEMRMPAGPPTVFGPMAGEDPLQNPLFNQEQLLRLRDLQMQAAWIYQRPSGEFIPPMPRPEFLEQEEKRIEKEREVYEMKSEIKKLYEENNQVRRMLEEQRLVSSRLMAEKEAMKYGTPEEGTESEVRKRLRLEEEDLQAEVEKEEGRKEDREQEAREKKEEKGSEATQIQIMVKLMEGMQALQNRILDGKDEDKTKDAEIVQSHVHPLPELCEWDPSTGPIDLGDWLSLIEPIMSDLSKTSAEWWSTLMSEASQWYEKHQQLPPLSRLSHDPSPSAVLSNPKWSRLEKRSATMLLRALPQQARDEMVSSKRLSAFGIVCQLLKSYQPGGLGEKELVLKSLEMPLEAGTIGEAVTGLRKWTRWRRRASELQIMEPDPFLLLKGLNRLIRKPLESHRDLAFRINLARSTLQVDATPTSKSVTSFASHLLAECEQVAHQEMTPKKPKEKEDRSKTMRLKRMEEEGKGGGKGKDMGKESWEPREKFPCKFFTSDQGCKKGKECRYLHEAKDEKRRCYICGSVDHIAPGCSRPRGGERSSERSKIAKVEGEDPQTNAPREVASSPEENEKGDAMKNLLEEANKMLKSLTADQPGNNGGGVTGSLSRATTRGAGEVHREEVMDRLQRQLDELRQKTLRISRMATSEKRGLLDSGATHALRPIKVGEKGDDLMNVRVTLADGGLVDLKMNRMGTMVIERPDVEPIVPMGALIKDLGCRVLWEGDQMKVDHPKRGDIPVSCEEGCPLISRTLALDLIQELEDLKRGVELRRMDFEGEIKWMNGLVESHPVLRGLPEAVKRKLVVKPGEWRILPGNRRLKKKWKREGMVAHWYAGKDEGFTLSRALQQQGGDPEALVEVDVVRNQTQDLLEDEGIYADFIRAALDGGLRGIIGGPNCRTRSVLRHYEVLNDPMAPRPVRRWNGEEFGIQDATDEEKRVLEEDDVLLWRMIFLFLVAEYLRKARGERREVKFTIEQPASPRDYRPEVVSWWDTEEWKKIASEFGFKEYTFNQGDNGGLAKKPTTFGGNLELEVPEKKGLGTSRSEGPHMKSKDLARWSPGTMVMVAKAIQKEIYGVHPKLSAVSWEEHLAFGHTPYRRDCLVCQECQQKEKPHRKIPFPRAGVLSLDCAGPLPVAGDVNSSTAKFMLVGAFTWAVPKGSSKLKEPEIEDEEGEEGSLGFEEGEAEEEDEDEALEEEGQEKEEEIDEDKKKRRNRSMKFECLGW